MAAEVLSFQGAAADIAPGRGLPLWGGKYRRHALLGPAVCRAFADPAQNSLPAEQAVMSGPAPTVPVCVSCGEEARLRCPCRSARYCSKACQKRCWREHRAVCHELRAQAAPRHQRWFDQSPRELSEQCIASLLRRRAKAEGLVLKPTDSTPETAARNVMQDPDMSPSGPTELGKAMTKARALFSSKELKLPDKGSPAATELQEAVTDVSHHLVQGARALMSDEEFEPFIADWVRFLFDPAVLLGTVTGR